MIPVSSYTLYSIYIHCALTFQCSSKLHDEQEISKNLGAYNRSNSDVMSLMKVMMVHVFMSDDAQRLAPAAMKLQAKACVTGIGNDLSRESYSYNMKWGMQRAVQSYHEERPDHVSSI